MNENRITMMYTGMKRQAGALALAAMLGAAGMAYGHGGDDHAPAPAAAGGGLLPRVAMQSEEVELLGVLRTEGVLTLYLDTFADNAPIAGATIELESGTHKARAVAEAPGVYRVEAPWLHAPGAYDLTVTIAAGELLDLVNGRLQIPALVADADAHAHAPRWVFLVGGLLVLAVAGFGWRARRGTATGVALTALLALPPTVLPARPVSAHGGEEHGEAPSTAGLVEGQPRRLPDGSLYLPKPTQHLLGVRTERIKPDSARRTLALNGRVIADPNASGLIAATGPGRLKAGPQGLPALGATVAAGQVLAYLEPALPASERAARAAELSALKAELAIAEARVRRYAALTASIPAKDRTAAETEARALRERVAVLSASLNQPEALITPVAGRVASAPVRVGQVVAAGEVLFTVQSPSERWVEAAAYDSALATRVRSGELLLGETVLPLRFLGAGGALVEQALPLQFALEGVQAETLALEQPVKVLAILDERIDALTLPATAVVRGAEGLPVVFVHTAPETFVPHRIEVEPVAGGRVAVRRGLEAGDRVVTAGASLLAQVR